MKLADAREFRSITGKGVVGSVDGKNVALGNAKLLEELNIKAERAVGSVGRASKRRTDGDVCRRRRSLAGLVGVADPVKTIHARSDPTAS